MQSGGSGGGLSSDINVTPMIDVLLVLLIIFMITLPLSRREFVVQVPPEEQPQQHQKQTSSDQIVLELRADGSYAINTQTVLVDQHTGRRLVCHQHPDRPGRSARRQVPRVLRPTACEAALHQVCPEPQRRRRR